MSDKPTEYAKSENGFAVYGPPLVTIECSCGKKITYDPKRLAIKCVDCGQVWSAIPELFSSDGKAAKRLCFEPLAGFGIDETLSYIPKSSDL